MKDFSWKRKLSTTNKVCVKLIRFTTMTFFSKLLCNKYRSCHLMTWLELFHWLGPLGWVSHRDVAMSVCNTVYVCLWSVPSK